MQRFRGGLVFKAHGLCVSLSSRLESNKEEEREPRIKTFSGDSGLMLKRVRVKGLVLKQVRV